MRKQFGIKDIAKQLGLSVSTVSRALRDAHDVSQETRKKVLTLTDKLKFKRNSNAAALASGSTKNIGVILPFITNYYFSTVISGIQEEAYEQGYTEIIYITNDDVERELKLLESISATNIDGLLISISSNSSINDHFQNLIDEGLPIVFFDRVPHDITASKVMQSDYDGAYLATKHLLNQGYNRIAHIAGPKELTFTQERLRGYIAALKDHKIDPEETHIIFSGFDQIHGLHDTEKLLELSNSPNAIFAVNDRKAVGAIQAIKNAGIKVGKQIGVIGFTNDPISTVIEPNLTTVEEPAFEIGRQSCKLLIRHIKNEDFETQELLLPCKLILRESASNYNVE
ncbi:MAG: LacI family DNA-binding transcriptional regulator [Sphingobacterium sp.]